MNESDMNPPQEVADVAEWLFNDYWFLYELLLQRVPDLTDEASVNETFANEPLAVLILPDLENAYAAYEAIWSDPAQAERHLAKMAEHVGRAGDLFAERLASLPPHSRPQDAEGAPS